MKVYRFSKADDRSYKKYGSTEAELQ